MPAFAGFISRTASRKPGASIDPFRPVFAGFAVHRQWGIDDLLVRDGRAIVAATPDEPDPSHARYSPDVAAHWHYQGAVATQYWHARARPGLAVRVNGRQTYWASTVADPRRCRLRELRARGPLRARPGIPLRRHARIAREPGLSHGVNRTLHPADLDPVLFSWDDGRHATRCRRCAGWVTGVGDGAAKGPGAHAAGLRAAAAARLGRLGRGDDPAGDLAGVQSGVNEVVGVDVVGGTDEGLAVGLEGEAVAAGQDGQGAEGLERGGQAGQAVLAVVHVVRAWRRGRAGRAGRGALSPRAVGSG